MKKNFLYVTLMLTFVCFNSGAVEGGAVSKLKKMTSSIDLGDFYKEKKAIEDIYEKLEKFQKKNPSAKLPYYENVGDLSVIGGLYDLSQKLGYEERKKGEETYYAIDISYPVIKRFAKLLVEKGNTQSFGWSELKDLLEAYGDISHVNGDKTKTDITPDRLNKFVELALLFFDLKKLENPEDQNKVREWMKTVAANYSGFQRIMSMMITLWIDFSKGVIVETPLTIKIEKTKNVSCFSLEDRAIRLEEEYFSTSSQWIPQTLFHEIGHAIHYHICGEYFYRYAFPFFVSSVSSSDALLDRFFPMLTKDNLDPEKNAPLKRIEDAVKEDAVKENGILKTLLAAVAGGQKIEDLGLSAQTILNIFYIIIGQGFGSIVFGDGWEDKTIVELLIPQNIALVLYMRALMFSTYRNNYWTKDEDPNLQSIDELRNKWLDLEEMLTIFGIVPFYFNNKLVVLEDRQNEQIFELRDKQKGEIKEVYRQHASPPYICRMNPLLSEILGVEKRDFFNYSIGQSFNAERDKLVFPLNPIYIEDTSAGTLPPPKFFFESSDNPLLVNILYGGIIHGNNVFVKNFLSKITTEGINKPDFEGKTLLSVAIEANNEEIVELLLRKKANLNAEIPYYNEIPLHIALKNNQIGIVKLLLDKGADTNTKDSQGEFPLHIAVKNNQIDIVSSLLRVRKSSPKFGINRQYRETDPRFGGLDPDIRNSQGETPLHIAVTNSQREMVSCLVFNAADSSVKNSQGETPIHIAVSRGDEEIVRSLLRNCDINLRNVEKDIRNSSGETPLHIAVRNGNEALAELLLACAQRMRLDRKPNIKNSSGDSPLHIAINNCNEAMVRLLSTHDKTSGQSIGLNIENSSGETPLHIAINRGDKAMARLLLTNKNIDTNVKDLSGKTPMHIAVSKKNIEIASLLLANSRTDPNIQDLPHKETPLHIAVSKNNRTTLRSLLANSRTNPNIKNSRGETPLHIAACKPVFTAVDKAVMESLLADSRINPNIEDNLKNTLLHYAALYDRKEIGQLLLDKKVKPNTLNSEGNTPLHYAAGNDSREMAQLLLDRGASLKIKNSSGKTPLDVALNAGHANIVNLLRNFMKDHPILSRLR
ncbi:MAG: ankyrin repeat domain-containing protein [Holosporaceae bacterium]|jgi:cytohesin|nr:ankyrin repeat domain-containing protein [Holosporaceae bacterium]